MKTKNRQIRYLAILLIVGGGTGIFGIILNVWTDYSGLKKQPLLVYIEIAGAAAVYSWTILKGIDLWRSLARGYKWAKVLFIAQIPVITSPLLKYAFYTGVGIDLVFGHVDSHFQIHLGSGFTLYVDPSITKQVYGLNLVALIALVLLISTTRSNASPAIDSKRNK